MPERPPCEIGSAVNKVFIVIVCASVARPGKVGFEQIPPRIVRAWERFRYGVLPYGRSGERERAEASGEDERVHVDGVTAIFSG